MESQNESDKQSAKTKRCEELKDIIGCYYYYYYLILERKDEMNGKCYIILFIYTQTHVYMAAYHIKSYRCYVATHLKSIHSSSIIVVPSVESIIIDTYIHATISNLLYMGYHE